MHRPSYMECHADGVTSHPILPPTLAGNEAEKRRPQTENLEALLCGQILQDEDNTRREKELIPVQITDKRPQSPHSQGPGDLFYSTCAEKLQRVKGREGANLQSVSDINYPYTSLLEPDLAKRCTHRKDPEINPMWTQNQTKQDDWPEETCKKPCIEVI